MLNPNQSREIRLITRDRKREFNDVRQSHSRRKDLSQSQLSKSVGKSRLNREFQNARETSRFTNIENEQSRCLKQLKKSQNNLTSRSHRDLMCPCCYNKKEAQLKLKRRNHEIKIEDEQMKQIKQSIFQNNIHKQLQYENQIKHNIQEMTEYNKKLMERHQHQKKEELSQKKNQGEIVKMEREHFEMEKENRAKYSQEVRQHLKQKYEEQMRVKGEKENRQKQINQSFDQQNFVIDAIVPSKPQIDKSTAEAMRNAYKEDLLRQIQQRETKKKKEIQDLKGLSPQKQVPEFQLVTFAQKRNEQARKIARQMKQNQLKVINEKRNKYQFSKEQKEMQRIERERERQKDIAEAQQQKMHEEQMRRQKIDNYLTDLKGQIEQNKKKRLQQLQWINDRKLTEPIIKPREEREFDKDSCKGCHKKYPKKMLSEFVTILE